jgi:thymidylate synthase (FAD)
VKEAISVSLIDSMGSDLSVVNAARVSFEGQSKVMSLKDEKLISYLARHKHTSPFNHAFVTVRVKAPIFVARQLVKHKFMPWNEVSRRYVQSEPSFHPIAFRFAADNVKQGSAGLVDEVTRIKAEMAFWHSVDLALDTYKFLLDTLKVCPEQARAVLPLNTNTEWVWSGSLGAFADMCRLRLDSHTQKESRDVAEQISALLAVLFPVSWKALLSQAEAQVQEQAPEVKPKWNRKVRVSITEAHREQVRDLVLTKEYTYAKASPIIGISESAISRIVAQEMAAC